MSSFVGVGSVMNGSAGNGFKGLHPARNGRAACMHEIDLSDLLGREVIPLRTVEAEAVLKRQVILVTGAAGSIGSELCRQLLEYEPELVIALDTNESGLFDLAEGLRSHPHAACLRLYIDDIKHVRRMAHLFEAFRPRVVFHAAAYKHVPLMEQFPQQAVHTNTLATYHLSRLACEYEVARFIFVSTDKAAAPVSVLGASKRLGELIVQSLAKSFDCRTRFCAVRFGNVIGSRGSVVPLFAQQIEHGGPVTVTDPETTRYFMTIPEACGLVITTAAIAQQGGLYMLDMGEPLRILDLAIKMIRLRGLREGRDVQITFSGLRPGERLRETLVASDEELVPTLYDKIFSVVYGHDLPTHSMIGEWMLVLDECLQNEDTVRLRERLFAMMRIPELVEVR